MPNQQTPPLGGVFYLPNRKKILDKVAEKRLHDSCHLAPFIFLKFFLQRMIVFDRLCPMKKKQPKARVNPEGFMGSASRVEKPKKGKGSFTRQKKHKKDIDSND